MKRVVLPVGLGVGLAGILVAASFGAMQVLPRPAPNVAFASRLAESVSALDVVRSVERVGGRRLRTVCRRLAGQDYLLTIPPRHRFVISGASLAPVERRWHAGQRLAVEVALSGCPSLLTALVERVVLPAFASRTAPHFYPSRIGRLRVYLVALTGSLQLIVERSSLRPVEMRLLPARLPGTSVLSTAPTRRR
jgi:hypothetical protein